MKHKKCLSNQILKSTKGKQEGTELEMKYLEKFEFRMCYYSWKRNGYGCLVM